MMLRKITYTSIIFICSILLFSNCSTTKKKSQRFDKQIGNAYFDSYYLYLTDTTANTPKALKRIVDSTHSAEITDLLARIYQQNDEGDSAKKYFRHATELDSSCITYLQQYYSILEDQQNDPKELLTIAQRIKKLKPNDPKSEYSVLMAYIHNNMLDSALKLGRSHLELFRQNFDIDLLLINLYLRNKQPDSAFVILQGLLKEDPTNSNNYFLGTTLAARSGDTANFRKYFQEGVRYGCPEDEILIDSYIQYMLQIGKHDELIGILDTLLTQCHFRPEWLLELTHNLPYILRRETSKTRAGKNVIRNIKDLLANSPEGQFNILLLYRRLQDTSSILKLMEECSTKFSDNYLWNRIQLSGVYQFKQPPTQDNWDKETQLFRESLLKYPFDLFPAFAYFDYVGQVKDSLAKIDTVTSYIKIYKKLLKEHKSKDVYTYSYSFTQDTTVNCREILQKNLSSLYGFLGDISPKNEKAFAAYKEALKYNRANEVVLNNYAYNLAIFDETKLEIALKMSKESLVIDPNNINYLDTYGYILYRLQRYQEAKSVFSKMLTINSSPGEVSLLHYADVLEALGNKAAADVYRQKATSNK